MTKLHLDIAHRDAPGVTTTGRVLRFWDTTNPQTKSRGWPNGRGERQPAEPARSIRTNLLIPWWTKRVIPRTSTGGPELEY